MPHRSALTSPTLGPVSKAAPGSVREYGCSGPKPRFTGGSKAAYWFLAPVGSPACPVQRARLLRTVRVSGCSGPRTRSIAWNSRAAYWSLAPVGSPACPVQQARLLRTVRVSGCSGAKDPLDRPQQSRVLVPRPRGITRLPGPAGKVIPGGQRVWGAPGPEFVPTFGSNASARPSPRRCHPLFRSSKQGCSGWPGSTGARFRTCSSAGSRCAN